MPARYKPKPTPHHRKLHAARIARWRANKRNGAAVYLVKVCKKDIMHVLRFRGLSSKPSKQEIEQKLSHVLGEIADRWKSQLMQRK
jgi:hypothetical protein